MKPTAVRRQIMICGLGGQGILFLSRVMAVAAMEDGDEVITAETHGMAQRGGAVEAHLKLGAFSSSLVRPGSADAILVLDATRVTRARALLAPDGVCFVNAPEPIEGVHALDAAAQARALEHPRGQNLILLGFAVATAPDLLPSQEGLRASLERHSSADLSARNREAFEHGLSLGGCD